MHRSFTPGHGGTLQPVGQERQREDRIGEGQGGHGEGSEPCGRAGCGGPPAQVARGVAPAAGRIGQGQHP